MKRNASQQLSLAFSLFLLLGAITSRSHAQGPSSNYYLTDGDSAVLQVARDGALVNSWQTRERLYSIAVNDTVKLYDRGDGSFDVGIEYTLTGTPTGMTYPWQNGPTGQLLDGGTDWLANNYAAEWNDAQGIWQFGLNWNTPTLLFITNVATLGITFDLISQRLWISQDGGNIQQVSNTGQVLSEFYPGPGRWGALAWQPETDTLWAYQNGTDTFRQWTKNGTLLQEVHIANLSGNIWGGEFSIVPEPASMWLAIGCIMGVGIFRRKMIR